MHRSKILQACKPSLRYRWYQGRMPDGWVLHQLPVQVQESGIPVPNHIIVNRDESGNDPPGFEETEDYVSLNGVQGPFSGCDVRV